MRFVHYLFAAGIPTAVGFRLSLNKDGPKSRPVTQVLTLLKKIQAELTQEGENDKEVYDKFACWCTTNEKEKVESIKVASEQINQLEANIKEYTATISRLKTEIADLEEEVDKNQRALDTATAIRNKEIDSMNAEEKDLIKSIRALKSAVVALSKHHKESLLQNPELLKNIELLLKQRHTPVTRSQRKHLTAFLQAPGDFRSHSSQSGQIFGILRGMLDTFEANLSTSQREELEAQRVFEKLKQSKTEEIKAGQAQIHAKNDNLANTKLANADAKQNLEDTQASKAADEAYLANLRTRCAAMDKEWDQRQASRAEELVAVGEAMKILSGDAEHDTFTATFNFLELSNSGVNNKRKAASRMLQAAASKFHQPAFAGLASAVRLDAFTKVKKAIDDMISALTKERDDEIKHKDWCNESFHRNLQATEKTQRNIDEHQAAIDSLQSEIRQLDSEVTLLEEEIAEVKKQVQRASETRLLQNKEFRATITEQRQTQGILKRAINVLKDVYERKEKARFALSQQKDDDEVGPPPPEGFKAYKKNENSTGVIGMLQTIIHQAENLEAETTRDERDAQEGYESFTKEAAWSVDTKSKESINKREVRAVKHQEVEEKSTALAAEEEQRKALKSAEGDLHMSCDFVLKNFDIRQEARSQEVEALRQAKAILSGSSAGR